MLRNELESAKAALEKVGKYTGVKLRYAYAKNLKAIQTEIKKLEELAKPTEDYISYMQEQMKLKLEHAEKDEKGQPKIENQCFVMKDMDAFITAAKELDEKFKDVREAFVIKQKEFAEFMKDESGVVLHRLTEAELPADITADEYAAIAFMIEGSD